MPEPDEIELNKPNAARVYDYYLGGNHNFAVDREMGDEAIAMWPELPQIMQANRAFLRRSVHYCVERGIRQFLDLGSGIPTVGNVHEVAQLAAPGSRWSTWTPTRSPWPTARRCWPTIPMPTSCARTPATLRKCWNPTRSRRCSTWTSRWR